MIQNNNAIHKKILSSIIFLATITILSTFCYNSTSQYTITMNESGYFINGKPAQHIKHTDHNNYGINDTDTCVYLETDPIKKTGIVVCTSGKTFLDVHTSIGSATGTPSYLYFSNYLGYANLPVTKEQHMPGASRRITYCVGPCIPKK